MRCTSSILSMLGATHINKSPSCYVILAIVSRCLLTFFPVSMFSSIFFSRLKRVSFLYERTSKLVAKF